MKPHNYSWKGILLLGLFVYCLGSVLFTYSYSVGPNYKNVTVDTTVNITDALPAVLSVIINPPGPTTNITLNAGSTTLVTCNATIQDYNGGNTITNVSARFYNRAENLSRDPDNNNSHYTNYSATGGCSLGPFDTFTRNVTCTFAVYYYADPGAWICNVTATDPFNFLNASREQSNSNTTNVDGMLALNVSVLLIDYGNMVVGDQSAAQQANVSNLGNQNINVSVYGYGNNSGDGLAMYCTFGNIAIENEKFNLIGGANLGLYTNLSNSAKQISGLTIPQQRNVTQNKNATYWILYVPPNPFGRCNGSVVFQAESS